MASEVNSVATGQSNLHSQDLSKLDTSKLTALSHEVISRQATINIGTIGHVAHGKSTVVKALSGVQTVRFKNELERNITIKLEPLQFDVNGDVIIPADYTSRKRKYEEIQEDHNTVKLTSYGKKKGFYANSYKVEKIVDYAFQYGVHHFLVKWEGWTEECNTWEPYHHLECPLRIDEYFRPKFYDICVNLCKVFTISDVSPKALQSLIPPQGFSKLKEKIQLQLDLLALNANPPTSKQEKKLKRAKESLLLYLLQVERDKQNKTLAKWEEIMNETTPKEATITLENQVDLDVPPSQFNYVNDYVPRDGVTIPNEPPIGCTCETCGPKGDCCGKSFRYSYRDNNKINVPKGAPVYECNNKCQCDSNCRNRVVQKGRKTPLCIFRTNNGRGWGVKALKTIYVGEFVCTYVGEVITHEEAEKRGEIYDAEGRTYLFDLDFNNSNNPYTVDAAKYGNVSHFINHSCDPNLGVWAVWINCLDPDLPQLALFAIKEIKKGEEITFDYMAGSGEIKRKSPTKKKSLDTSAVDNATTIGSPSKTRLDLPNDEIKNRPVCKCESKKCRRYLF